jgi:hypothetical protein
MAKDKKQEKQMDPQAMMEVYQKLATPGEPHKQLASLAGSWTTKTKEWMEPGKPPTESTGTAEMKMLLDGRFLYQEYSSQTMGQPFSGLGSTDTTIFARDTSRRGSIPGAPGSFRWKARPAPTARPSR